MDNKVRYWIDARPPYSKNVGWHIPANKSDSTGLHVLGGADGAGTKQS